MYESMKEFREEQKRLQETSWSFKANDIGPDVDVDGDEDRDKDIVMEQGTDGPGLQVTELGERRGTRESEENASMRLPHDMLDVPIQRDDIQNEPELHGRLDGAKDANLADSIRGGTTPFFSQAQNDPINYLDPNAVEKMHQRDNQYYYDPNYVIDGDIVPQPAAVHEAGDESTKPSAVRGASETTRSTESHHASLNDSNGTAYQLRLTEMLDDMEKQRKTYIVSWRPHGRAFKIHDETLFEQEVCKYGFCTI
jgi:hypothetical protein